MKKIVLLIILIAPLCLRAQTTVVIRPHFADAWEANILSLDSTSPYWAGNPFQYVADSPSAADYPEFLYFSMTYLGCPYFTRHLIRFTALTDTSVIPAGATINSAKLYLYGLNSADETEYNIGNTLYPGSPFSDDNTGVAYVLSDSFPRNGLTWNTQPPYLTTDSALIPISSMQWGENDTVDVTNLVTYLIAHGNTGLIFRQKVETAYREREFATGNFYDTSRHPMLIVNYTAATEKVHALAVGAAVTVSPNPAVDNIDVAVTAAQTIPITIELRDMTGRLVLTRTGNVNGATHYILPVADLAPGNYVVEATSNSISILRQKIVKQ